MTTTLARIRAGALRSLIPARKQTLTQFLRSNVYLPPTVSATPGRWEPWGFHPGIADAISDPAVERVTLIKPVRAGLTTLIVGTVASYVVNDPANILVLLPTEADCRGFVVDDLEPIFGASPNLAGLLSDDSNPDGRNTLTSRRFPAGTLKVVPAKSPRNLRKHNVRILLMDEIDAVAPGPEGNPLTLAERRTLSFPNRKIIAGSTPTDELTSNVARLYERGNQSIFESACPSCGSMFEILWQHIEWQPDRPETAACRCPHCNDLIDEKHKPAMVAAGAWRAQRPEITTHASFRLNALVSPHAKASWGILAAEFLQAKAAGPDELRVFVNTILGQTWRDTTGTIDEADLMARAEPFGLAEIPAEVLYVTAGSDVQRDRIETVIIGHDRDGGAMILAYVVIWGSYLEDSTWADYDELLKSTWQHPNGGTLRVDATFLDSGDGVSQEAVYAFCRPRIGRRVFPIKGAAGWKRPLVEKSPAKGITLMIVASDVGKAQVMNRLGHGTSIRFSADLPAHFYETLMGERLKVTYSRGQPVKQWAPVPGRRNEGLDCTSYGLAARAMVTIAPDRRAAELSSPVMQAERKPVAPPRRVAKRSLWDKSAYGY